MEIRQLKYFVAIAETNSFSEASRKFYLSQSAISQQIKILEDELGIQLFKRTPHNVSLTEGGRQLLPLALKTLSSLDECYDKIGRIKGLVGGELNIGLTYSLEPYLRETAIMFMRKHPMVQLNVYFKTIPELMTMLRNRQIDIAFCISTAENQDEDLISKPTIKYHLCAILRKNHRLANKEKLTMEDLKHERIILPETGVKDRNAIERYFGNTASVLNISSVINDANAIMNVLQETNMVSILPEQSINNRPLLKATKVEGLEKMVQSYSFILKDKYKKQSVEIFLKMLSENLLPYQL